MYTASNLASAPHDARVDLPAGTVVVFEELEAGECKKTAMDVRSRDLYAGNVVVAAIATTKPTKSAKTPKAPTPTSPAPTKARKPVSTCENAEVQVEVCQTGSTPDYNPGTVAVNCVHLDLDPTAFAGATGLTDVEDNQSVTLTGVLTGKVDKD